MNPPDCPHCGEGVRTVTLDPHLIRCTQCLRGYTWPAVTKKERKRARG